jgi:hypothetical protein
MVEDRDEGARVAANELDVATSVAKSTTAVAATKILDARGPAAIAGLLPKPTLDAFIRTAFLGWHTASVKQSQWRHLYTIRHRCWHRSDGVQDQKVLRTAVRVYHKESKMSPLFFCVGDGTRALRLCPTWGVNTRVIERVIHTRQGDRQGD